jgi:hypothetical protein
MLLPKHKDDTPLRCVLKLTLFQRKRISNFAESCKILVRIDFFSINFHRLPSLWEGQSN